MLKFQDVLETTLHCWYLWKCHPQSHPEPDTAVRLTQQLGSTTVFLTSQKQLLHHLSLWLSWNILLILWFVQSTVSRALTLPAQTWCVIPAQRGTYGPPLKHYFKMALMMKKTKHKLWSEYLSDLFLSVRIGDVSDYQRTSILTSPKHKIKIYTRYALNSCQPKSRINSQLIGNAMPNSFKSYLYLAFYEGCISLTGLLLLSVVGQNSSGCSFTRMLLVTLYWSLLGFGFLQGSSK